jgi:hypothetical protein
VRLNSHPFALKSLPGHTTLAMTNHCVAAV